VSVPVLLQIVLNMQLALQAISTANGYFNDIKPTSVAIDPVALMTVPVTEVPYLVVGHLVEPIARSFQTSRPVAIRDTYRITIEARVDAPGFDTARKLTAIYQFAADVEKALLADLNGPGSGLTRNFLAMDTRVQIPVPHVGLANENVCYVEIPVEILMQRQYGQP
jgi:hypothetical protein